MFKLDTSDIRRVIGNVSGVEKQMRFATAVALTRSMNDGRVAEQATQRRAFDNPTPYTLNALQVKPATKDNLYAELGFKEGFGRNRPAWKFLGPEIVGGARKPKAFERALIAAGAMKAGEFAVPGSGAPKNGYGNVPGSFITRMLSALGASSDATQNRNRKKRRKSARPDFFVVRAQGKAGIYRRQGREIVPVFLFVRAPSYRKRLPHYEVADRVIPPAFKRQMQRAVRQYVLPELRRAG